ncbi:MAG: hypothetical protein JW943_10550 [Deltaproteobacteria bacterium]|nr:hypothetical protein [Deltaproteobacteria bacterium]
MYKFGIPIIVVFILLAAYGVGSAQNPLSRWIVLRSDSSDVVRDVIRSEVDKREGFSTYQEEQANLRAVEDEKDMEDGAYKKAVAAANREFNQAKKRRDDLTSRFQAAAVELEDEQKNINTIKEGIENLDNQIVRYNQDITAQQDSLKKWLQMEKHGEALVAVIFTRGFRDSAHAMESAADRKSAPLMAQHMGAYIQSYSKVIDSVLSVDFIRAIEEGSAKWNNEEPLRIELAKGNAGTTYLRMKRYEMYPFQAPGTGRVRRDAGPDKIKAAVITSRKELNEFLSRNGYSPAKYDFGKIDRLIRDTVQMNAMAEEGLREQIRSFQERIGSLKEKIRSARSEKDMQLSLLKKKEEPFRKTAQEREGFLAGKQEAERAFEASQRALYDKRRVRETIIIKTALATARGSQSPADASAEAIIDKLAEVKNDAKMQHSTSTTEVTDYQVTAESSMQAITEALITAARLISFINEGDSVRVKMAFRIRTVLDESPEGRPERETLVREPPVREPPSRETPDREPPVRETAQEPPPKEPKGKSLTRFIPSVLKPADRSDDDGPGAAPAIRRPIKRNPNALGSAEVKDVLFEIIRVNYTSDGLSVFVDMTNMMEEDSRSVGLYDDTYGWIKSKMTDNAGQDSTVSQVVFWNGQKKQTTYEAGRRGPILEGGSKLKAQFIFKKAPAKLKSINKLTLHPYVYFPRTFGWSWQEKDIVFQNIRISR